MYASNSQVVLGPHSSPPVLCKSGSVFPKLPWTLVSGYFQPMLGLGWQLEDDKRWARVFFFPFLHLLKSSAVCWAKVCFPRISIYWTHFFPLSYCIKRLLLFYMKFLHICRLLPLLLSDFSFCLVSSSSNDIIRAVTPVLYFIKLCYISYVSISAYRINITIITIL